MKISDILMSGYKNQDYGNPNFLQVIQNNKQKIFDFEYGIDPLIKQDFETMFLLHFFDYEIATPTDTHTLLIWKVYLSARLNNIFPLYNQFISAMKKSLTGERTDTSTENHTKDNTYKSQRNGTNDTTINDSTHTTSDSEVQDTNKFRDFPNSAISNTDTYLTNSGENNTTTNVLTNSAHQGTTGGTSTDKIDDIGNEQGNRNNSTTYGISDLDFINRFRNELTGVYDEIFKYCADLFIFVW